MKSCLFFLQESFAQRCFTLIDEYAPGFSSSVIGYDMLTPPDLEREIGLTGILCLLPEHEYLKGTNKSREIINGYDKIDY